MLKKNATYTSKTTQNDIIACIDEHISNVISERISKSKFFSVIADETTDNNRKEQLSVSVRYLDEGKVREDFLGFVEIDDLSGKGIAEKIVNELMRHNIDLFYMIGQGYDGASAMSGGIKGCQAIIREKYPAAVYIHCAAHCLNLVISKSSQVPAIRNCWNDINEIVNFFHFSPQRIKCMENIIQKDEMEPSSQLLRLHKFSDTRWVERHDALIVFKRLLPYVIEALTDIASWKNDGNARSLLKKIDFEFIVSLSVLSAILTETRPLSQQLQAVSTDMLECSTQIKSVHEKVQSLRENDVFDAVYQDAIKLGLEINVNESVPRLANRQPHRSNHPSSTPSEYYRRAVFIPFLDFVLSQFEERFSDYHATASSMCSLIPSYFHKTSFDDMAPSLLLYKNFLINDSMLGLDDTHDYVTEFTMWRSRWSAVEKSSWPTTILDTYEQCSPNYPVTKKLLLMYATLPVSSATAERSFSTLNHIKSYRRATMGEDRLNGLAKVCIHRQLSNNDVIQNFVTSIIDIFSKKKKRRKEFII